MLVHYFTAPWCGPCKVFGPRLEQFAARSGVTIHKHDVDEDPGLASDFGIMSVPTTIWIDKDGNHVATKTGALSEEQLQEIVSR